MSQPTKLTRREFLKDAAIAGAVVAASGVVGTRHRVRSLFCPPRQVGL